MTFNISFVSTLFTLLQRTRALPLRGRMIQLRCLYSTVDMLLNKQNIDS